MLETLKKLLLPKSSFLLTLSGCTLLWLALPPVELWGMVFLAPVPWILLILRSASDEKILSRFYFQIWLAGTLFWLAEIHFIRYPHPVNYFLWLILAGYEALFLTLFVILGRRMVDLMEVFKLSYEHPNKSDKKCIKKIRAFLYDLCLMGTIACIWWGCEILRSTGAMGLTVGALSHALYRVPRFIQSADITGQAGVCAVITAVAYCVAVIIHEVTWRRRILHLVFMIIILLGMSEYGKWRMRQPVSAEPMGKIALIQGAVPASLMTTPELIRQTDQQYFSLTEKALRDAQKSGYSLDLIVWPEGIYRYPVVYSSPDARMPAEMTHLDGSEMTQEEFLHQLNTASINSRRALRECAALFHTSFFTGCGIRQYGPENSVYDYNSVLMVHPEKSLDECISGRYDKNHLVLFGEYIPFTRGLFQKFPGLASYSPIGSGMHAGNGPGNVDFMVTLPGGEKRTVKVSASICFEAVMGQVIRSHVAQMRFYGIEPDILLNVTNNGWFCGGIALDEQLICGIFRAVENRKPYLVAANCGFSASVNSNGEILLQGKRNEPDVLIADIQCDSRRSFYSQWGGWLRILPLIICGMVFFKNNLEKWIMTGEIKKVQG